MAGYTRDRGRDFWYDFDNQTLHRRTPEMKAAISQAYGPFGFDLSAPINFFRGSFSRPDHPQAFLDAIAPGAAGFRALADAQRAVFQAHFDDLSDITSTFADFGQGVLFDNRPPRVPGILVHMMDGTPTTWIGYHRWHAFIRGALLSGAAEPDFWRHVLHCVALAWGIQTEANPRMDAPDNPGLPAARLQRLADYWLNLADEEIDRAFVLNHRRAPPPPEPPAAEAALFAMAAAAAPAPASYVQVQTILDLAATTGDPIHDGNGRFWNLPLDEFLAIGSIRGVELIATPGADRGARSGLIRALKGEGEFGPDGTIPRMPRDRPPVSPEDIAYIQRWIDEGCAP